jgi:hypothetical protein
MDCGTGLWYWIAELDCGTVLRYWIVILDCGTGLWYWNLPLMQPVQTNLSWHLLVSDYGMHRLKCSLKMMVLSSLNNGQVHLQNSAD